MKKIIKIMVIILSLSVMYQFADAQGNCPGNKIKMSKGVKGCGCTCTKKCVDPVDVQTYLNNGWFVGDCVKFCCSGGFRLDGNTISPETFLTEVYPNPATGVINIDFTLSQQSEVTLEVFDMMGKYCTTIAHSIFEIDGNEVTWDASTLNQGIYFLRMKAGNYSAIKRISIIK
jgi:hypothetical protein